MTAYKQIMPRLTAALTGMQKHNKIYTPLITVGFYPRDVLSTVLATATWLGGWMSHAGIVSKWLNLS